MKSYPTITNLKDFISLYGLYKSNIEIASLLDISIDDIESVREELLQETIHV